MRLCCALLCCTTFVLAFNADHQVFKCTVSPQTTLHGASRLPASDSRRRRGDNSIPTLAATDRLPAKRGDNTENNEREQAPRHELSRKLDGAGSNGSSTPLTAERKGQREEKDMLINAASAPLLAQVTAVVAETLVNTDAAYSILTPLHKWTLSKRRVAAAVKEEERAIAADKAKRAAAARRSKFFARFSTPPAGLTVPPALTDAYNTLKAAVEAPGKLASGIEQTAEYIVAAPAKAKQFVEDLAETTINVVETVSSVPQRARQTAEAAAVLGERTARAVAAGADAYESWRAAVIRLPEESRRLADGVAVELARASEAFKELPSTLPTLLETVADEAQVVAGNVATGTLAGLQATSTVLLVSLANAGGTVAEGVLRQALLPIHAQRLGTMRVSAAVSEEKTALLPPPSTTGANRSKNAGAMLEELSTASAAESSEGGNSFSGAIAEGAVRASTGFPSGLRQKFFAWRQRRRSVTAPIEEMVSDQSSGENILAAVESAKETSAQVLVMKELDVAHSQIVGRPEVIVGGADSDLEKSRFSNSGGRSVEAPAAGSIYALDPVSVSMSTTQEDNPRYVASPAVKTAEQSIADARSEPTTSASATSLDALGSGEGSKATAAEVEVGPAAGDTAEPTDVREPLREVATALDVRFAGSGSRSPGEGNQSPSPSLASFAYSGGLSEEFGSDATVVESPTPGGRSEELVPVITGVAESYVDSLSAAAEKNCRENATPMSGPFLPCALVSAPAAEQVPTAAVASTQALGSSASSSSGPTNNRVFSSSTPTVKSVVPLLTANIATPVLAEKRGAADATTVPDTNADADSETMAANAKAPSAASVTTIHETAGSSAVSFTPLAAGANGCAPPAMLSSSTMSKATTSGEENAVRMVMVLDTDEVQEAKEIEATATGVVERPPEKTTVALGEETMALSPTSTGSVTGVASARGRKSRVEERGGWGSAGQFLTDWMKSAIQEKKAQLEEKKSSVCWERQWYPVALVDDLPRRWCFGRPAVRIEMLGRAYEVVPKRATDSTVGLASETGADGRWACRVVTADGEQVDSALDALFEVPLQEASGMLWAWPDVSSEGIAIARVTHPPQLTPHRSLAAAAVPVASSGMDRNGEVNDLVVPSPWRRLLRNRSAESAHLERTAGRRRRGNDYRYRLDLIEREIPCGYADVLQALSAPQHAAVVRAAAGGNPEELAKVVAMRDIEQGLSPGTTLTSVSSSGFEALVDRADVRANLSFAIPNVVEWRLSSTTINSVAERDRSSQRLRSGDKVDAIVKPARAATPAPEETRGALASRPRWLRWRGLGRGGDSSNSDGNEGGGGQGTRSGVGKSGVDGAVRYVAVVLPVSSGRTKVFLRLETTPVGLFNGASFWWSRRIRRALLVKALNDAADYASRDTPVTLAPATRADVLEAGTTTVSRSKQSKSQLPSVKDWLAETIRDGPAF